MNPTAFGAYDALEQRVGQALDKYLPRTELKNVKHSIVKGEDTDFTMYASCCFIEATMEIKDLEIVVDPVLRNDPHLEIRLCHELGHLDNVLRFKKKAHIDPTSLVQKLYVEVMADRNAAKIYGTAGGRKAVTAWLSNEINLHIKYFRRHFDLSTVRMLVKPFMQLTLRYGCSMLA